MNHFHFSFINLLIFFLSSEIGSGVAVEKFQEDGLNLHNVLRARHGTPPLVLDDALNEVAHKCAMYYSPGKEPHTCPGAAPYGENIVMQLNLGPGENETIFLDREITAAIQRWYDEKRNYNFDEPTKSRGMYGHFTQLMWRESKKLGLGCYISTGEHHWTHCVAIYDPAGNWKGSYEKNIAKKLKTGKGIDGVQREEEPEPPPQTTPGIIVEYFDDFDITTQNTVAG